MGGNERKSEEETLAQELDRLRREIAERETRIRYLVAGDPLVGVSLKPLPPHFNYEGTCDHKHWTFEKHGRRCSCGAWMVDFGD